MTSFTINLPKYNLDNKGTVKNRIMKAIEEKLPFAKWHGIHTPERKDLSIAYAGPEDYLGITNFKDNVYFHALNKKFFNPCIKCSALCPFAKSTLDLNNYDGITELDLALRKIEKYAKWLAEQEEDPGYDFIYMGQPVRIYQNFIQIGNAIIPLNDITSTLNRFSEKKKNNYINIIINISKTEIINNFE